MPRDCAEAVYWFTEAAEQGNAQAQIGLGWMFYKGYGVPNDYHQAYAWWNIATSAAAKKNKGIIAKRMTAGDISKAQALSKEMLKENPNLLSKGGSETSPSMPIIKGFQLGMPSDEAKKNVKTRLGKNYEEFDDTVSLGFTDDKLSYFRVTLKSEASTKLFNADSISFERFVEEFRKAYDLPITFKLSKRGERIDFLGQPTRFGAGFETITYSYENTELGYSIKIETKDLVNKTGSRSPPNWKLEYKKIITSSALNLGD